MEPILGYRFSRKKSMRFPLVILLIEIVLLSISERALAQECTHLWQHTMEINPSTPKPMSGDTYASYGLVGFHDKPGLRLEMRGQFHHGRFMSFERYRTKQKPEVDA